MKVIKEQELDLIEEEDDEDDEREEYFMHSSMIAKKNSNKVSSLKTSLMDTYVPDE